MYRNLLNDRAISHHPNLTGEKPYIHTEQKGYDLRNRKGIKAVTTREGEQAAEGCSNRAE